MNIELPKDAKKSGVRVRWWQPPSSRLPHERHHLRRHRSDWVIDDIVIGGKEINPNEVNDDFSTLVSSNGRQRQQQIVDEWLQLYNVRFGAYCGVPHAAIGAASSPSEQVITSKLTTYPYYTIPGDIAFTTNIYDY